MQPCSFSCGENNVFSCWERVVLKYVLLRHPIEIGRQQPTAICTTDVSWDFPIWMKETCYRWTAPNAVYNHLGLVVVWKMIGESWLLAFSSPVIEWDSKFQLSWDSVARKGMRLSFKSYSLNHSIVEGGPNTNCFGAEKIGAVEVLVHVFNERFFRLPSESVFMWWQ